MMLTTEYQIKFLRLTINDTYNLNFLDTHIHTNLSYTLEFQRKLKNVHIYKWANLNFLTKQQWLASSSWHFDKYVIWGPGNHCLCTMDVSIIVKYDWEKLRSLKQNFSRQLWFYGKNDIFSSNMISLKYLRLTHNFHLSTQP